MTLVEKEAMLPSWVDRNDPKDVADYFESTEILIRLNELAKKLEKVYKDENQ
jgi:hypothetical protein